MALSQLDGEWWQAHELGFAPDLLALHAMSPGRYPFLLESVAHGTPHSRYSVLMADAQQGIRLGPDGVLEVGSGDVPRSTPRSKGSPTASTRGSPRPSPRASPRASPSKFSQAPRGEVLSALPGGSGFLDTLEAWVREFEVPSSALPLPFCGGWFVYLGYELAAEIEGRIKPPSGGQFPWAAAYRVAVAIVYDHQTATAYLVHERGFEREAGLVSEDLAALAARQGQTECLKPDPEASMLAGPLSEDDPERYTAGVARIKQYIRDGDVFQVNLSRAWRGELKDGAQPWQVYARLRDFNPAPFAGLALFDGFSIMSSSPERLVQWHRGAVQTRPIAGTYPRGSDAAADRVAARSLLNHPKEQAEHIMLIDLERNDLGRICEIGSVEVSELMGLETYTHVHHIVSNVAGVLRPDKGSVDVIRAVFPGGTITGCPKVRCMEIIAELENEQRGPYTGSMGYINRDGSGDLNILIRTLSAVGSTVTLRAGAGIVADSVAEREVQETRHKARGPLSSLLPRPRPSPDPSVSKKRVR